MLLEGEKKSLVMATTSLVIVASLLVMVATALVIERPPW